jgi:hypothetical protein
VLGIVDENFAAGVLYAIDYVYNTTYNLLVYNMGATSTQVTSVARCGPAHAVPRVCLGPCLCAWHSNSGLWYDQVSIHSHDSYVVKDFGKNKTVGQFKVVGKAWDTGLGGAHFDNVLMEKFADVFNAGGLAGKGERVSTCHFDCALCRRRCRRRRVVDFARCASFFWQAWRCDPTRVPWRSSARTRAR